MSMQSSFEAKSSYLHISCSGTFDLAEAGRVFQQAFDVAAQQHLLKVLVDIRSVDGDVSTMDRYAIGDFIARQYLQHAGIKVGVVGAEPLVHSARFGATVARNRGAFFKAATDLNEVLEWLDIELVDESGTAQD